jgi:hypothetical protein
MLSIQKLKPVLTILEKLVTKEHMHAWLGHTLPVLGVSIVSDSL